MSNRSQTDFGFGVKLSDLWWKMKLCLCEPANAVWQEERWNASIAYNCVPEEPNVFFIQNWKRLCSWTLCVLCKGIVWPLAYSVNFFHSIIPHDAILGHVMFFQSKMQYWEWSIWNIDAHIFWTDCWYQHSIVFSISVPNDLYEITRVSVIYE